MTLAEFIGCSLIGYGPPLIVFTFTTLKDPLFVIVCVASAFFWILSLLISAAWWMIVFPLKDVPAFGLICSVLIQELFRYFFYLLMRGAEKGLSKVWAMEGQSGSLLTGNKLAFVSGLGFGIMSCTFSLVNLLAALYGPGSAGLTGQRPDFYLTSACLSLGFFFLHTFWSVIFFHGFQNGMWHYPAGVVVMHLSLSALTMVNQRIEAGLSMGVSFGMVFGTMFMSYNIAGGSNGQLLDSLKFW